MIGSTPPLRLDRRSDALVVALAGARFGRNQGRKRRSWVPSPLLPAASRLKQLSALLAPSSGQS